MIDQISFRKRINNAGVPFEQAVMWVAGVPFTADLDERTERVVRSVAKRLNQDVCDIREQE